MNLRFETVLPVDWKTVREGFNLKLFSALAPPGPKMHVQRFDGCSPGNEVHLKLGGEKFGQQWVSVITKEELSDREWFFIDEGKQMPWPLKRWKHLHRVVSLSENITIIVDDIHFECAPGLTRLFYPLLWFSFSVRPARYRKFFQG